MKPFSVLMTSTSYPKDDSDWRARFIADMVASLAARDDLRLFLWAPPGKLPNQVFSLLDADDARFLESMSQMGGMAHLLRTAKFAAARNGIQLLARLRKCFARAPSDLLHINWLQNALALPCKDKRPVLITVLGSDYRLLGIPGVTWALRHKLRGRKAHIAPNAEWMAPMLHNKFGDIAKVEAISFGIDAAWYSIRRSQSAASTGRWLTVARVTRGKIGNLFAWGKDCFVGARTLHLLGPHQDSSVQLPSWVHYHGPTFPEALASDWFPEAAGLVSLSQHDEGRPQVMLEAMAAGLPVIASDLPAHRDIIQNRKTGFLVSSQEELHEALDFLSVPENNLQFGSAARELAVQRYGTWADCATRYHAAYTELLRP